jgi:hypothetical protein
MKAITNVAMRIVLFVRQQLQVQDTGVTSNRIRAMRMITLLHLGRIQVTMWGGKIITVHEILVLIVTKRIEIFLTLSQVIILTKLYGSMSKNLGFMVATKKVGSTDKNFTGLRQ